MTCGLLDANAVGMVTLSSVSPYSSWSGWVWICRSAIWGPWRICFLSFTRNPTLYLSVKPSVSVKNRTWRYQKYVHISPHAILTLPTSIFAQGCPSRGPNIEIRESSSTSEFRVPPPTVGRVAKISFFIKNAHGFFNPPRRKRIPLLFARTIIISKLLLLRRLRGVPLFGWWRSGRCVGRRDKFVPERCIEYILYQVWSNFVKQPFHIGGLRPVIRSIAICFQHHHHKAC